MAGPPAPTATAAARLPFLLPLLLGEGAGGLTLLFITLRTPERRNSGMVGTGGGVEEASVLEPDTAPAPAVLLPDPAAPLDPAANPLAPASAAPAAMAPTRTKANAVDPTSPDITFLAMKGTRAMASAYAILTSPRITESGTPRRKPKNPLPSTSLTWLK